MHSVVSCFLLLFMNCDGCIIEKFVLDVNQKKEPSVKQGHLDELIVNRLKGCYDKKLIKGKMNIERSVIHYAEF